MELSNQKKQSLLSIYHSDGLQVIFDIMEDICNQAENNFLATHPTEDKAVLAAHVILHSQRDMFQKVVARIDTIAAEQTGVHKNNQRLEDFAQLLSALPITEDVDESQVWTTLKEKTQWLKKMLASPASRLQKN